MEKSEDINIFNEELAEFEFEKFSIFYDKKRFIWFLESTDEDVELNIVLTPEVIEENEKKLKELDFEAKYLDDLKSFLKGLKNDKN